MGVTPARGPGAHEEVLDPISPNFITTRLDFLANWARSNSLWPMPFGTACCAIEFMATAAARFANGEGSGAALTGFAIDASGTGAAGIVCEGSSPTVTT